MTPWTPNPKLIIFFYSELQDFEGLNSSLAQSAAELWLTRAWPEIANVTFCETFLCLSKTGFLSHNFGSRYASKSIKGSKHADQSLVSKKT